MLETTALWDATPSVGISSLCAASAMSVVQQLQQPQGAVLHAAAWLHVVEYGVGLCSGVKALGIGVVAVAANVPVHQA
jgi:hypothetical protein